MTFNVPAFVSLPNNCETNIEFDSVTAGYYALPTVSDGGAVGVISEFTFGNARNAS